MKSSLRTNLTTAIVAASVATTVALTGPQLAQAAGIVGNADKVDGLHANQLNVQIYKRNSTNVDNLTCTPVSLVAATIKAPAQGVVLVSGASYIERDGDTSGSSSFIHTLLVDGKQTAHPVSTAIPPAPDWGTANVVVLGGAPVSKGTHSIKLQGEACGVGMAYVYESTLQVSFSPFGTAPATVAKQAARPTGQPH